MIDRGIRVGTGPRFTGMGLNFAGLRRGAGIAGMDGSGNGKLVLYNPAL